MGNLNSESGWFHMSATSFSVWFMYTYNSGGAESQLTEFPNYITTPFLSHLKLEIEFQCVCDAITNY
jgi:hypothetical protein